MFGPVCLQGLHDPAMEKTNGSLEEHEKLRREPGPALAENQVVSVFNPPARESAEQIERGKEFLNIEKSYVPRVILRRERGLQSIRRAAVTAARMVKHNRQLAQASPEPAKPGRRALAADIFVFCIFDLDIFFGIPGMGL